MYEVIIGLEVHLQLKTKTGMFCGCKNEDSPIPNSNICPICTGQPGTLPVPNRQAIELAGILSLALEATIQAESVFARKNYFYPDLPKAYQITQYELPFAIGGSIEIETTDLRKKIIHLERLHLEEDAAKSIHLKDGSTAVDFNRAGVPLVEIVSKADLRSGEEAQLYVQAIQSIARACQASDADMEKGQMRCDVNISLRPEGETVLRPKTEIKNINSIRAVERSILFEVQRQTALWEAGTPPSVQETRGWDDAASATVSQRTKEQAADYRYFVDPDIPPLRITPEQIELWRERIPELPHMKRTRFMDEYGMSKHDAGVLVGDVRIAGFFEEVISELRAWLNSLDSTEGSDDEVWVANGQKLVRLTFGWITGDLFKLLHEQGLDFSAVHITAENFAELLALLYQNKMNRTAAAQVLARMLEKQDVPNGSDPSIIMQDMGLEQQSDTKTLEKMVDAVIASNPDVAQDVRGGRKNALMFLVGKVMKESKGTANPQMITDILRQRFQ